MGICSTGLQELVDTIDVWKRAYERICIARDEIEAKPSNKQASKQSIVQHPRHMKSIEIPKCFEIPASQFTLLRVFDC